MIVAGVMSGTSADGLDVAVVEIERRWRWKLLAFRHAAYPARERAALIAGANLAELDFWLGRRIGRAVAAAARGQHLDLIASHGQTIAHAGRRGTLQIGNAAVIAAVAGAPVVSDFRSADIAQGGEGAPLVPWADWKLFTHPRRDRVALNLGGIANLTVLPAGAGVDHVRGFDTGPANMALDAAMAAFNGAAYDRNGALAARGSVHDGLLAHLLRDAFFRRRPPKSAGREQFGAPFVAAVRRRFPRVAPADFLATLTELTARTVAAHLPAGSEVIVAGGGSRNRALMRALAAAAPGCRFLPSDAVGVPSQAREAIAFALLGAAHLWRVPANLPQVTGASKAVVLGSYTPAPAA